MIRRRLPIVAVVGRPNVGKSTLFNRVVGGAVAVVDDFPGVTRDRREAQAEWTGTSFSLVDTGGLVPGTQDAMESAILEQVRMALEDADAILFIVDAREGITSTDREIAAALRPSADKVVMVANKVESELLETESLEAAELGFGTPVPVSGQHGRGVGDLLDVVIARIPQSPLPEVDDDTVRFTLAGRPNVGKSSLANRLLGEPRMIVHHEAGTTRDNVDVPFRYDGRNFILMDTAGLRRRSHVVEGVEYYSTLRTRRSISMSDVVVMVIDASEPITAQDSRIVGLISDEGKSVLFLYNKWDLVDKKTGTSEAYARKLREAFPLLSGSPVLFVSAISGQRVQRVPAVIRELYEERRRRVSTHLLNEVLQAATERVQPPTRKNGKPFRFYYATQVTDSPPTFAVFTNDPGNVPQKYEGYLRNVFRDQLDFQATPIRLEFRARR